MRTPRRQIFLPLPPLSAEAVIELIDVLETVISELRGAYRDEIRELYENDTPPLDTEDIPPDDSIW